MSNPNKNKGSQFERDVVAVLRENCFQADRAYGAGRPDDVGDINGVPGIVFECKNAQRFDLSGWMDEAEAERVNANAAYGVVVVKRRGKSARAAYAIVCLDQFAELLQEAGY